MTELLYTDDNPMLQEVLKKYLEQTGWYSVDTAASALEALEMIRKKTYDAIISDYQMSGMDGVGLLAEIRNSGSQTPFVILYNKKQEGTVVRALKKSSDFYLEKKVGFWEDLLPLVESILKKRHKPGGMQITGGTVIASDRSRIDPVPAERTHPESNPPGNGNGGPGTVPAPVTSENFLPDLRALADILDLVDQPVLGIDRENTIIIWNAALARLTGIDAKTMIGKNGYAHAIPFYGTIHPMLVDSILHPELGRQNGKFPPFTREGEIFMTRAERIVLNHKPALMSCKGCAVTDPSGQRIAAIQAINVTGASASVVSDGSLVNGRHSGGMTLNDPDMVWLDESWMRGLTGRLQPINPFSDLGDLPDDLRYGMAPQSSGQEGKWSALEQFAERVSFPLFGIDCTGRVIAWNAAMEVITGIPREDMIGSGGYAHAKPFFRRARPMLVDSIIMHLNGSESTGMPGERDGEMDTITGDPEEIWIGDRPMRMQEKATYLYDAEGTITAAIESVIISESFRAGSGESRAVAVPSDRDIGIPEREDDLSLDVMQKT